MQSRTATDMKDRKRVLLLEPFYGGSHKLFADGLAAATHHEMNVLTLPARFWKWRMRGAALHFARTCKGVGRTGSGSGSGSDTDLSPGQEPNPGWKKDPDLVLAGSLMSASDFRSIFQTLYGKPSPPVLLYMHENQFTYPLAPGEQMDYQFAFTDITSALAAERILFNSGSHMEMFLSHAERFIRKMPDARPGWASGAIREKAFVCHPGCEIDGFTEQSDRKDSPMKQPHPERPPLIIWNHRWEHDKNPEAFFDALAAIAGRNVAFRVAVLGERFEKIPDAFREARTLLGPRVAAFGWEPDRKAYFNWLLQGEVVVSTAIQENFGISIVEAAACGCIPLVPDRLSYPEIIPESFHDACIYRSPAELEEKLARILSEPRVLDPVRNSLAAEMVARYSWKNRIREFDRHIAETANG